VVVVGVVQRSPVELWHVHVPKPELPRWRRYNSNKLWLKLVPKRASRDAVERHQTSGKKLFHDVFRDLDLMLRHEASGDIHAPSSILRGSDEYQMHVLRDHAQAPG
jgi:hypothetical protein